MKINFGHREWIVDADGAVLCLKSDDVVFIGDADDRCVLQAGYLARAMRTEDIAFFGWRVTLARDGTLIHLSEHASLMTAVYAVEKAIYRAESLRMFGVTG